MGLFDLLNKKNASVLSFIEEGTRFHESGQFAHAVDSFEKALSQDPGRYDAWVGRGSALFYLDRYSDALTSFEKAIEIDPRRPDAWKNRGRTLHELGRPSDAIESYEKAIDYDPRDIDTLYYRGLALHELGRLEDAIEAYEQILKTDQNNPDIWFRHGVALDDLGQYVRSIESYNHALAIDPSNAVGWYNCGVALERVFRPQEAVKSYQRALEIAPNHPGAQRNLPRLIEEMQRSATGISNEAISPPDDGSSPEAESGLTLPDPGSDTEKMLQEIDEEQIDDPDDGIVSPDASASDQIPVPDQMPITDELQVPDEFPVTDPAMLPMEMKADMNSPIEEREKVDWAKSAKKHASEGSFEEALLAYEQALREDPGDAYLWVGRGLALENLEQYDEAVDSYDHALKLDPGLPDTWNNRGVALTRLGRHKEALESYNRALLLDPVHGSSWMNKARTLAELGRPADAVESYDRALAINPGDASAWYNRGVLLSEMGETEESAHCFDKALAIGYKTGKEWYKSPQFQGYIDGYAAVSQSDDGGKTPGSMPPERDEDRENALEMGEEIDDADPDSLAPLPDITVDPETIEAAMAERNSDLPTDSGSDDAGRLLGSETPETVSEEFGDLELADDLPEPDGIGEMVDDADPDPLAALPDIMGDLEAIEGAFEASDVDVPADSGSDNADIVSGSEDPDNVLDDFGEVDWEDDLLSPDSTSLPPEISVLLSDIVGDEETGEMSPPALPDAPVLPDADDDVSDPDGVEGVYGDDMVYGPDTFAPSGDSEEMDEEPSPEEEMVGLETDSSFAEILKYYDRAVLRSPDDADLWYNRGLVLYNLNRYRDAVVSFERAVAINPDYAEAERNRRILMALIQKKIVDYERKGTECATGGRFDEAVVYYDQVLSLDPEAPSVWYNRGVALRNLGRYEEAVASYDHSLSLVPDDPGTWYNRGVALRNLGRYEDAIESYDRALALDPDDADTWHNRGVALRKLGRHADAVASFDRALSINQQDAAIWYNRGVALRQLGRYDHALESYDQMLALDPENPLALNNRGFLLNELGRHEEAAESYNKSILLNPENAAPWVGRGIAEFNLGHYAAAVESLNRALGIDHEDSYSWQVHGLANARLNKHAEAVLSYDHAIALDPSDARIWVIRGLSLMGTGNYPEAVLSFERALLLDPDNPDIVSHRDEAARMIPVEQKALMVEETSLRSGVEPGPVSSPERDRSLPPAASFSVTLDHSRFIRNQWYRVPLTIQNDGGDPLINLLISFSEDFATRRLIPVTVPPADQVTIDIGIKPLSVGMVPLDLKADYRDEEGHEYTRIFEFWIEVLPEP